MNRPVFADIAASPWALCARRAAGGIAGTPATAMFAGQSFARVRTGARPPERRPRSRLRPPSPPPKMLPLKRDIPPANFQQLIKEEGGVEGERKPVVVLFVDVSGFTSLSETFDPEDIHQIMSQCFEIFTGEVHRFEGTVNSTLATESWRSSALLRRARIPPRRPQRGPCHPGADAALGSSPRGGAEVRFHLRIG